MAPVRLRRVSRDRRRSSPSARTSFAMVLGAGGRPGLAYHAGTLLALELHGFRPADATSITGTSAGSIATALFAAGGTVEDLAAYAVGARPRPAFEEVSELMRAADLRRARIDLRAVRRSADARRAVIVASHLVSRRFMPALVAGLPGIIGIADRFEFLDPLAAGADPLTWRIVAADGDARRHVLAADDCPLSRAVAASCAVPGVFAAVRHDGRLLVDGGVHSTTNADLAGDDDADTVIVLAPMCGLRSSRSDRSAPHQALTREVALLEAKGRRTVTFRPSPELTRLMGRNPLAAARSAEIAASSFLEATDVLSTLPSRRQLA
jgi:NTE family protein